MFIRWPIGKNNRNRFGFPNVPYVDALAGGPDAVQNPGKYAIELRDKNFKLKARLEPYVTQADWDWNRTGGCGRATIRVSGNYSRFAINADDDIRIWLTDSGGTSATLWYRGYVESAVPRASGGDESIQINCMGYSEFLNRLIIQSGGTAVTYTNTEISQIVSSILSTFVTSNSPIAAGTINASNFVPDTMSFKTSVKEALNTLSDLLGNVEWGVDASLNFYWLNQKETISYKLYLGDRVTSLDDNVSFREIVNQVYLEGGKVGSATYLASGSSADSIARYGRHEVIFSNGSITSSSVATQYITGILRQGGRPVRPVSVQVTGTNKRFETSLPIGTIAVVDPNTNQSGAKYGKTANGGDNKIYGTRANSGSGQVYGGTRRDQLEFVTYSLYPENGRVDASLQLASSAEVSLASAFLKRLELTQDALRQRSL